MAVHPLHRQDTDTVVTEPWTSDMASVNILLTEGIEEGTLLLFEGEACGVSRFDDCVSTEVIHFQARLT